MTDDQISILVKTWPRDEIKNDDIYMILQTIVFKLLSN